MGSIASVLFYVSLRHPERTQVSVVFITIFFYILFIDGRKDKNDNTNDNIVDIEQKNQEISSLNSQHSSILKIDPSTIAGTNRTSYRNISYRNENCACKIIF